MKNLKLHIFRCRGCCVRVLQYKTYKTVRRYMAGIDFPWVYCIIPDIPQLCLELTQTFPVYTQTSPDCNHWMPGLFPNIHWVIPSLPWLPLIYGEKPISALRTPCHSLMVTWWSYIPTDNPCWYGNFFFKEYSKEVEIFFQLRSPERHA